MTTTRARRRRRGGWMSATKGRPGKGGRTPVWQWVVGVPLVALVAVAIVSYIYVAYVNPKLGVGAHFVRAQVLERLEKRRPDGGLDTSASSILVKIDGKELRLAARQPEFDRVAKGDPVEVEVSSATGSIQAFSWRLPVAPIGATGSSGP